MDSCPLVSILKTIITDLNNNAVILAAKSAFTEATNSGTDTTAAYIILIRSFDLEIITYINNYISNSSENILANYNFTFFLTDPVSINLYSRIFRYIDIPFSNLSDNDISDLYSRYIPGQIIALKQQTGNLINTVSLQNSNRFATIEFKTSETNTAVSTSNQDQAYTTTVEATTTTTFSKYIIIGNELYSNVTTPKSITIAVPGMVIQINFKGTITATIGPKGTAVGVNVYLALEGGPTTGSPPPSTAFTAFGYIVTTSSGSTVYFCIPNLTFINQNYFPPTNVGNYYIYCQNINCAQISVSPAQSIYNPPLNITNIIAGTVTLNTSATGGYPILSYPFQYNNYVISANPNDFITVYAPNLNITSSSLFGYVLHFLPIAYVNISSGTQVLDTKYEIVPISPNTNSGSTINGQGYIETDFSEPLGYITFQMNSTNAKVISTCQSLTKITPIIPGVLANGLYVIYPQQIWETTGSTVQSTSGIQVLIEYPTSLATTS